MDRPAAPAGCVPPQSTCPPHQKSQRLSEFLLPSGQAEPPPAKPQASIGNSVQQSSSLSNQSFNHPVHLAIYSFRRDRLPRRSVPRKSTSTPSPFRPIQNLTRHFFCAASKLPCANTAEPIS